MEGRQIQLHEAPARSQSCRPSMHNQETALQQPAHNRAAERLLYISHFLSTWNSRLFEFGAFLFLASIYPATLLPASVYALARAAAAAVLSPWIGSIIDRKDRLSVIRLSIAGQRIPTLLSCLVFFAVLSSTMLLDTEAGSIISITILAVLAGVEKLSFVANTISVERDWVVVIAGDSESSLSRLNARMRRIDLFCKLVAPLAVSLLAVRSTKVAVMATGLLNAISCLVEYLAIAQVYKAVPLLRNKGDLQGQAPTSRRMTSIWQACNAYATSPVMLPSLALSLLYLTALSFAGQLITYLLAPPISFSAWSLSIIRGIAACVELSATFGAPILINRIGPLRAGSWFLNAQLLFIGIAAAALMYPQVLSGQAQTAILIVAVILSRFGLWGFDLAAQQQIQCAISEASRGSFSAVEAATQNLFEMISFAATIIWSKPEQFRYPGVLSAAAVAMAAVLYAIYVRRHRGHLLHLCTSQYWKGHFRKATAISDDQDGRALLHSSAEPADEA